MKTTNKLLLGVAITALSLVFVSLINSPRSSAIEATSSEQLQQMVDSLKKTSNGNITGKLGDQTITFKKEGGVVTGLPTPVQTRYVAENLDCGTEKAVIVPIALADESNTHRLNAKYRNGSACATFTSQIVFNDDGSVKSSSDPTAETPGDDISCETGDSGPLGWILCPVIEASGHFTGFVFEKFVQPFLEDVPVTTNSEDASYKAWNNFRIIGNIILVGTMLAVVYAQIRGDR